MSTLITIVSLIVITTSLWMAVDSWRLNVRVYKSQLAAYPFVLFTAGLGLWIVVFPMYLLVRRKLLAGQLTKAENPKERYQLFACIGVWCVLPIVSAVAYFMTKMLLGAGG